MTFNFNQVTRALLMKHELVSLTLTYTLEVLTHCPCVPVNIFLRIVFDLVNL